MKFLGLFLFLVFLLSFYRKKHTQHQENVEESFWTRENQANHTRRKDISGLPYITIPLEKFPMGICDNSELKESEQALTELSEKKILNLCNQLKLQYGPANLTALSQCDQNYVSLCRTLVSYGECLLKLDFKKEARTVLEFGIECGTDLSKNYLLLADIYLLSADQTSFDRLRERALALDSPMKTSILKHLEEKATA